MSNDSYIVDGGGQTFEGCATRYKAAMEHLAQVILKIKDDARGIDWTDDNGVSLQASFKKFCDEADKIPERLKKNADILSSLSETSASLNNNLKNGIDGMWC